MSTAHLSQEATPLPGKFTIPGGVKTIYSALMLIGALAFALGLFQAGHESHAAGAGEFDPYMRIWASFLTSFVYFTDLALGGLFFAALQHVAKAGWSVNVRRFMESLAAFLPYAFAAGIVLLFGARHLYEWMNADIVAHDYILRGKASYLNGSAFGVRMVIFFVGWLIFSKFMVGNSVRQDADGDPRWTLKNVTVAIAFLLFFALSYSLFSVDTLMSLAPHWYSTIWGVYNFAGLFQSAIATVILISVYMMRKGLVRGLVNENHLHDLGKYLKAFTVFYAYIGFSQFLLIWYANLPEETIFYLSRANGTWMAVTWSLLVLKFAVPFLLLLPKAAKRSPAHLTLVSILVLAMQYVDIHWMVYPNVDSSAYLFGWQEAGVFAGFLGLFMCAVLGFLSKHNLTPTKDPRLEESLHHHVTY